MVSKRIGCCSESNPPRFDTLQVKLSFVNCLIFSREQIVKEAKAMNGPEPPQDFDWGIIAIKGIHLIILRLIFSYYY